MARVDSLTQGFLAQYRIAIVGVSRTRDNAANNIYRQLSQKSHRVFAVNPKIETFDGDPGYSDLKSLPENVAGVMIVTCPAVSKHIVQHCIELGIRRVWMHDMRGTRLRITCAAGDKLTSVSAEAVHLYRDNGFAVIPGACPLQFIGDSAKPACAGHYD